MKTFKASMFGLAALSFVAVQARAQSAAMGAAAAAGAAGAIGGNMQIASIATAAVFTKPCVTPGGQWACPMVALSLLQAANASGQKSGSKQSQLDLTSSYGGTAGTGTNADPSGTYTTSDGTVVTGDTARTANALTANGLGGLADDYVKSAQAVQASGVSVSADGQTVTLPNGKKVASSSYGSADGMRGAGFSNAEIANAENALANDVPKAIAAAQKKVGALTNDVGGGGGGLAGAGGRGGGSGYGSGGDIYGRFGKAALGKKAPSVSGLSKKFGSDNIGVSGDDIFEMITRRYQSRDKADAFLKN